jgi:hypothetical protein
MFHDNDLLVGLLILLPAILFILFILSKFSLVRLSLGARAPVVRRSILESEY